MGGLQSSLPCRAWQAQTQGTLSSKVLNPLRGWRAHGDCPRLHHSLSKGAFPNVHPEPLLLGHLYPGKPGQKECIRLGGYTFWRVSCHGGCPSRALARACVTPASPRAQEPPPWMGPGWHSVSAVGTWWPALAFHGHPWLEFCPGRAKATVPISSSRASQPPRSGRVGHQEHEQCPIQGVC